MDFNVFIYCMNLIHDARAPLRLKALLWDAAGAFPARHGPQGHLAGWRRRYGDA